MIGLKYLIRSLLGIAFLCGGNAAFAQSSAAPLELVVLGSGGPGALGRASSCYLALIDQVPRILVDAGSGAFVRLGETHLDLARIDTVLLTHLHVDHASELPALFKARAVSGDGPIEFKVFGPGGSRGGGGRAYFPSTRRFVDLLFGPTGAFAYLRDFAAPLTIDVREVAGAARREPRVIYREGGLAHGELAVSAVAGHHGDAPAVIYRIDYAGESITFSGDIDRNGLPALSRIARGSDLLVFDTTVLDPPGSPPILYELHTPPLAIGQTAQRSLVHALLLSHLSPATEGAQDAVMQSIRRNYSGSIRFAQDGLRVQP
ncbi:MAG TPA: MBL fold metallo-hydrolase [Steroidobacteraceae bacterium]|nr:MBL fold metallo-hydrolase [Steroidobacteraceae bacterium]